MEEIEYPRGIPGEVARLVYGIAKDVLNKFYENDKEVYTGGCAPFTSPQEWAARKETYGLSSLLIIVHDGGDFSYLCNPAKGCSSLYEQFESSLRERGLILSQCTCWYSCVYPSDSANSPNRWKEYQ